MRALPLAGILALALMLAPSAAAGQELGPTVSRLASAWARGDYNDIGARTARAGLSIALDGDRTGPFSERQAASALKRLFEDHETLSARPGKHGLFDGKPRRAWVEISWTARTPGSRAQESMKVVFGLIEEGDVWRINEIRLMR